jgi:glycosyltransferase involved in cell wall biosynthesis
LSPDRKNILVFIDWFLPGFRAGGPIRSCANLIAQLGHEFNFYIVTRNTDYCETTPYQDITFNEWTDGPLNSRIIYLSEDRINRKTFTELIHQLPFDCVYLNSFFSYSFTLLPLQILRKTKNTRVILAPRGMLAPGAMKIKGIKKQVFIKVSRLFNLYGQVEFQATSEEEVNHIRQYFPQQKIHFAPALHAPINTKDVGLCYKNENELNIICIARIAPEKNVHFALESLKSNKDSGLKIKFTLVGPVYDEAYFEQLKNIIEQLPDNCRVELAGAIPNHELSGLMQQHHLFYLPTLGENFGHSILEAFCNGLPVLISDKTPWRNLEEQGIGFDLSLQHPERFTETIVRLAGMNSSDFEQMHRKVLQFGKQILANQENVNLNRNMFEHGD